MKWIIQIAQKEEGTVYSPKATSISKLFSSDMVLQKLLILLAKAHTILLLQKEDKFLTIASCVLHIRISFMSYQQLWRKQNQHKRTNLVCSKQRVERSYLGARATEPYSNIAPNYVCI